MLYKISIEIFLTSKQKTITKKEMIYSLTKDNRLQESPANSRVDKGVTVAIHFKDKFSHQHTYRRTVSCGLSNT